jgi:ATP/maltotriose-dependent transcriptional regulator MalT
MEIAKEAGFHYEVAINAHQIAECYLRLGEHKRAFAALRSSYEIASEHAFTKLQMANMRLLGFIDATRFGSAEGRSRMLDAIGYAEVQGYVWDLIQGKYMLAIVDQQRGDLEGAARSLREVLDLAANHGHRKYIEDTEQAQRQLAAGQPIALPV